jgi:Phage P22-like portal protein
MSDDTLRDPDAEKKLSEEEERKLLARIRANYEKGVGANEENRRMFSEDLRFAFDSEGMGQWAPEALALRKGRPSYTFNRVIGPINHIIADQRQSRPDSKFRPASQGATQATADVYDGLWRCMWRDSRADATVDQQFKYAVAGGFGEWRLIPEYENDHSFDQVLRLRNVPNPLTVIRDPECYDPCGADAMWALVADRLSKDKYKELYPQGPESSFVMSRDSFGWFTDDEVRVAEYWERIAYKKRIGLLDNDKVVELTPQMLDALEQTKGKPGAAQLLNEREVVAWKVRWCKVDGSRVLEGPIDYDWQRIPLIRVPGRYINIEGRQKFQSAIRHSKDAQRSYNFRRSDMIERSSLIPKAPYLVTAKMIQGFTDIWSNANVSARPYLPYNVDKDAPDMKPTREAPIDLPAGALALAQQDSEDIQATTGFFDPALGNAEDMNRVSGKALIQHTRRSDLGSYEFIDGFGKALQLTAEMFADMVPTVYDSKRIATIVGKDDAERLVELNGDGDLAHDLTAGRYDVTVTLGPSWQTARQEALATLLDAVGAMPILGQMAPDLIVKNMDSPDAEELARRVRLGLIRAGIVKPTDQEKADLASTPPPPPDPRAVAETQEAQAKASEAAAKAAEAHARVQIGPIETNRLIAEAAGKHLENLKTAIEIGQPNAAAAAEAQAAGQDLQQQDAAHAQQMTQAEQLHQQGMRHRAELHAQNLKKPQ